MGLQVNKVSFGYTTGSIIIDDISFEVKAGGTLCILGASGSGKSTLLKVIAGLLPASPKHHLTGSVAFDGAEMQSLKEKGGLSFMFQEPGLMPNLTVMGNVEFPARLLNRSFRRSAEETISTVGLLPALNKFPGELSGGMQTRTALARSFITQPRLLLMDEAFSSLDQGWRYDLYRELKQLQQRDTTTVVMVTHDIDEALELADLIYVVSYKGRLLKILDNHPGLKESLRIVLKDLITQDHLLAVES